MSAAYAPFPDAPLAHEIRMQVEQQAPFGTDGADRVLGVMQRSYQMSGDERLALCDGLEQLREELAPHVRTPRGERRPPSRKAKRRVCAAIDHFIEEVRARHG